MLSLLSVLLWYTDSDYPFGIFWPLFCLLFYDIRILITPLVSFGHCVVCSSMIYGFWLPLCIFWALFCPKSKTYYFWRKCVTWLYNTFEMATKYKPVLGFVLSALLWYTHSDYPFVSFGRCVVCCSMIYGFWLPLRYLQTLLHRRADKTKPKRYKGVIRIRIS
jgi:hypothetical protein